MATFFAQGACDGRVEEAALAQAMRAALDALADTSRTLIVPPDATRAHSGGGRLTQMLCAELRGRAQVRIMPATGTHFPLDAQQIRAMFADAAPPDAFIAHNWRRDLARLGAVPSEFVHEVSAGALRALMPDYEVPVEVNRRLVDGSHTAVVSIGQVVPHEVVGMANGVKNLLIGCGGVQTINRTHFLSAVCGMERIMGRAETPVRAVLNYAGDHYLAGLAAVYVLTVVGPDEQGRPVMRGVFVGDDHATFLRAAELSRLVNVTLVDSPQARVVAFLDPAEARSTWLGNKAVYRTRMMIADGGELLVLAPGVRTFGEDAEIDRLVRRHGYRGTPATLAAVRDDAELRANLSAAAHLIHGSSEGRFRIVYATDPSLLSRREVEGVGYEWQDARETLDRYDVSRLRDGPQDGFYYVGRPALGLWAARDRFAAQAG